MTTEEEFNLEESEKGYALRSVHPEMTTSGKVGLFRGEIEIEGKWISTVWNPNGDNRYDGYWNLKLFEKDPNDRFQA